ncbi:unnamed protein product [Larinioides sclopetarius]|uniref:Uncharacterized protein n=1 Tax=Larinioides sclopetarius TaxID=280406 RepID=A0AAV1Z5I0_9ARAC
MCLSSKYPDAIPLADVKSTTVIDALIQEDLGSLVDGGVPFNEGSITISYRICKLDIVLTYKQQKILFRLKNFYKVLSEISSIPSVRHSISGQTKSQKSVFSTISEKERD